MLINLSNHPSDKWDKKQRQEAVKKYGTIFDLPFPAVNPDWSETEAKKLAKEYFDKISLVFDDCSNEPKQNVVHIQGEFTFVFYLVYLLLNSKIKCIASTSERKVVEKNGKKIVVFKFVRFRGYSIR